MIRNKSELRQHYLSLRRNIVSTRKEAAAEKLFESLQPYLQQFDRIASFYNTQDEIDMGRLNALLLTEERLLLPKTANGTLQYYRITHFNELVFSRYGLFEPDPNLCSPISLTKRDLILVPALAFDAEHYRLGFGKGYFDRFLADHPGIVTAGIGFIEQMSQTLLPRDSWDMPVQDLFLF